MFGDRPLHYDSNGEPISLDEWAALRWIDEYRHVGNDFIPVRGANYRIEYDDGVERVEGMVRVSTVWFGIDMGYGFITGGPPLIFETMIFGGAHHESQWRYATHAEAVAGHAAAVELVRREAHAISQLLEVDAQTPEPPSNQ